MTQLHIQTQFSEGQGSIEMQPPPDESGRKIIDELGLGGVEEFVEFQHKGEDSTELVFPHATQERLNETAALIAKALRQAGNDVSFGEKPPAPAQPTRPHRWPKKILGIIRTA